MEVVLMENCLVIVVSTQQRINSIALQLCPEVVLKPLLFMNTKQQAAADFLGHLEQSVKQGRFIKLTLSKPGGQDKSLKNVYARLIELKGELAFTFTLRYPTKDITKNYPVEEGLAVISLWLGDEFLVANLFTLDKDYSLQYNKKRKGRLFTKPPSLQEQPPKTHNQPKQYLIDPNAPYLAAMEISSQQGKVLAQGQRKFRQINKYIEIIGKLIEQYGQLPSDPHIVDMGSGKGYLTFALYQYLTEALQLQPTIKGIELRENLVRFCNELAQQTGYQDLSFAAQDIQDYQPERIDMLIALHACDIATDIAIAKGIAAEAGIIVVAPCCHKQVRKEMACPTDMQAILQHGIMEERQAEIITDGIRALLMEAHGYETKVFEFISTEHTPKNVMIVGTRGKRNPEALDKVAAIKEAFGVGEHYLERLLK